MLAHAGPALIHKYVYYLYIKIYLNYNSANILRCQVDSLVLAHAGPVFALWVCRDGLASGGKDGKVRVCVCVCVCVCARARVRARVSVCLSLCMYGVYVCARMRARAVRSGKVRPVLYAGDA